MAASYPSSAKAFTPIVDGVDYPQAAQINQAYDEITSLEQALVSTGLAHNLFADATGTRDLGTSAVKWRDLYLSRNAVIGGTLAVTGVTTFTVAPAIPGSMSLLYANSGSDTSAGATTVDSIAITGLTAKDTLIVELTLNSVTAATARPHLYHVTDGGIMVDTLNSGSLVLPAGNPGIYGRMEIRQKHTSATALGAVFMGFDPNLAKCGNTDAGGTVAVTTAWTSPWTLGLRHNGVTATGTFHYSWAVYKLAGQ